MGRLKLFIPLIVFIALAGLFLRGLDLDPNVMPSALIDKPLPGFSLPRLDDEAIIVSEQDLLGEVALLNVWATWCVACRVEHPFLNRLAEEEGIKIIGINYKDDVEAAREWLEKLHDPYRYTIVDADGRLGLDLGVFGAPETYVIDAKGIIRYKQVGIVDERVWQQDIKPLLANLEAESKGIPN
jgi:cytochrome c biogenesis protein CcmG/thiol:disulfide interchange protein DsbE